MKTIKLLLLLAILLLLGNCAASKWKETLVSEGKITDAVSNAIIDFLNTSKLSKKDSIFEVLVTDTKDGIVKIGICGAVNKIYPRSENKIGTYDEIFPSQYIVRNGKLFYWSDTTQVITQEIISVLGKYNHIDFHWNEEYIIPPLLIDDGKEGIVYYFCKNDYKNYKKTGSNTIRQHFTSPKLNCNK